jgi:PAS domain S-box-containing protein
VILVSMLSEPEDIIKALDAGADSYLTKPYPEASMLARIRSLPALMLHRSALAQQVEYNGKRHTITADPRQILNLLLSVYENTLSQNKELISVQTQLNQLNDVLEGRVEERTAALKESEARYKRITEGLTDYQYTVHIENGHIVQTTQSPACVIVTGYAPAEFAADPNLWLQMIAPEDREQVTAQLSQILAGKDVQSMEHRIIRKDGQTRWVSDTTILFKDATGKLLSYDGVIKDISERKRAELRIKHLNRILRTISACNQDLVRARSEQDLLTAVCRNIVNIGGYLLAWITYPGAQNRVVAHFGDETVFQGHADLDQAHEQHCLVLKALQLRQSRVCNRLTDDPENFDQLQQLSVNAILALPLLKDAMLGVLTICSATPDAFDADELSLMEELAANLAYGIEALRIGEERDRYVTQLSHAMKNTVTAIARTLEIRDPYTAGHQQRVTELSVAIGQEMGLKAEILEALYFGAMIHDIGKICVPAEILSKPGAITKAEFQLIKSHPETGFDIVQGIELPWKVTELIAQHHERLDGSGYPKGLKGDEISLEARIVAVADVIDAMSSHRPYRPALGFEAALAEILHGRGTHYDPVVVDACLVLFRDKGFAFKT